jgi:hypothetical protein
MEAEKERIERLAKEELAALENDRTILDVKPDPDNAGRWMVLFCLKDAEAGPVPRARNLDPKMSDYDIRIRIRMQLPESERTPK